MSSPPTGCGHSSCTPPVASPDDDETTLELSKQLRKMCAANKVPEDSVEEALLSWVEEHGAERVTRIVNGVRECLTSAPNVIPRTTLYTHTLTLYEYTAHCTLCTVHTHTHTTFLCVCP